MHIILNGMLLYDDVDIPLHGVKKLVTYTTTHLTVKNTYTHKAMQNITIAAHAANHACVP